MGFTLPGLISVCARAPGGIKARSTVLISDADYDMGFYERLRYCTAGCSRLLPSGVVYFFPFVTCKYEDSLNLAFQISL